MKKRKHRRVENMSKHHQLISGPTGIQTQAVCSRACSYLCAYCFSKQCPCRVWGQSVKWCQFSSQLSTNLANKIKGPAAAFSSDRVPGRYVSKVKGSIQGCSWFSDSPVQVN